MSLGIQEKSELIFKEIKNSYVFWSIKKSIKEEVVKGNTKAKGGALSSQDIGEMIPRLLSDLNLETKIKNKVHEILDKNGYFKDQAQIAVTKFKNCNDLNQLP
jgi:transcription initiation factor TFIIIB Brf1 subunit/transcription initiation factor TFIIB